MKHNHIKLFFALFIACILWIFIYFYMNWVRDTYIVTSESGDFFDRMSELDLKVRGSATAQGPDAYRSLYMTNVKELDLSNPALLDIAQAIYEADKMIGAAGLGLLAKTPWKLRILSGGLENNYPHTLGDVIYIPENWKRPTDIRDIAETLIHEKVHVFQRQYPELVSRLLSKWGFKESRWRGRHPLQRNNPDINELNYELDGWTLVQLYTSYEAVSLADSAAYAIGPLKEKKLLKPADGRAIGFPRYIRQIEHPYEIMACMLARLIATGSTKMSNGMVNKYEKIAIEWLELLTHHP